MVVVSADDAPELIYRTLDHGVSAFVPKRAPLPVLVQALQAVLAGEQWLPPELPPRALDETDAASELPGRLARLTPQQFRVLGLLAEGLLNKQIADRLAVSEATIKAHVTAILRKLGVYSRTQAALALRDAALPEEP